MAHTPFPGTIPDDRLYCPDHDMWGQELGNDEVLIGATSFGIFLAGEIIAFTAKPNGAEVELGRGMGTVACRKTVLAARALDAEVEIHFAGPAVRWLVAAFVARTPDPAWQTRGF